MTEREDRKGVEETAAPWEPKPVLHARPVQRPLDLQAMVEDARRRFPKILARLAE